MDFSHYRLQLIVLLLILAIFLTSPAMALSKSKGTYKGKVISYEKGPFGLNDLIVKGKKDEVIIFKVPKKLQYIKPKKDQKVIIQYEKIVTERRTIYMVESIELK